MIPISRPLIEKEEIELVNKVLTSNELTNASYEGGKYVREFERLLSEYTNAKYAIAINSGTSALYAALLSLSLKSSDEVIIPSLTFVATANAVVAAGAKPVFADIREDDYTIDANDIEKKITKNTKAIIPVHIYGHTAEMTLIRELASKHSLYVIEDACQSLGSIYKGKHTGTLSDLGCYSFYPSKVLTSGEGGAIVTNNKELADKIKMIRNHGMLEGYDTRILGMNLRMGEINAAIAIAQMHKLEMMLEVRRSNAYVLNTMLDGRVKIPKENSDRRYNWYLYSILVNDRDYIQKRLNELGIGASVYYRIPVHKTPFYGNKIRLPITEYVSEHILSLPIHPLVKREEIEYIGSSLIKLLDKIL
ncbi:MAG: DegT/DnrJ/EryC1/StrS family aminotransferase [Candidatus Nitrosocaldaceae archaeon]